MRERARLYTLDGLRGVAAIIVLLSHLAPAVVLAPGGYLAVDFFFVLSGVVIAENYGDKLRDKMSFAVFMRLRILRFYPLYALGLILGLLRALSQVALHQPSALPAHEIVTAFIFGLAVLPCVTSIAPIYPLIGPAWTLMFELVANALYAGGMVRWRVGGLLCLCAVAAGGLWLVRSDTQGLGMGGSWHELHIGLLRVLYSFFIGVALYEGVLRRGRSVATPLAVLPIGIGAVLMIADAGAFRALYDWLCIVVVFPVLVWLGARWNAPAYLRALFSWLGETSYPLYTTHYSLIFVATFAARRFALPPAVWVPVLVVTLLFIAHFLARRFDEPLRAHLRRYILPRSTRTAAA